MLGGRWVYTDTSFRSRCGMRHSAFLPFLALMLVNVSLPAVLSAQDVYPSKDLGLFTSKDIDALKQQNTEVDLERFAKVQIGATIRLWDDPSLPSSARSVYVDKLVLVEHLPRSYYFYVDDLAGLRAFVDIRDIEAKVRPAYANLYRMDTMSGYSATAAFNIQRLGPLLRIRSESRIMDFVNNEFYEDSTFFRITNVLDDRYAFIQKAWYEHQYFGIWDLGRAVEAFQCLSEPSFSPDRQCFLTFGASFFPPKVLQLFSYKGGRVAALKRMDFDVDRSFDLLSATWRDAGVGLVIGAKGDKAHQQSVDLQL